MAAWNHQLRILTDETKPELWKGARLLHALAPGLHPSAAITSAGQAAWYAPAMPSSPRPMA